MSAIDSGRSSTQTQYRAAMREAKKSICIISFSRIDADARVTRQIRFLSRDYDVAVIGYGDAPPAGHDGSPVRWLPAEHAPAPTGGITAKLRRRARLLAGRLRPSNYDDWYWGQPQHGDALGKAVASGCDAFHANDWNALPIAAEAARRLNARLVFDAHEYAPLEFGNRPLWRIAYSAMITHMLRRYAPQADAMITVAPDIAERYRREFGVNPQVVLNAPHSVQLPERSAAEFDFDNVRLIHHGASIPDRGLEVMIEALAQSDRRYTLHFMLTGNNPDYVRRLDRLAGELTPGRVSFHDPVAPEEIVRRVSAYDMGFCFIAPTNYNYLVCLPNKFFEYVAAALPVVIGPSPSMAEIVRSYKLGCIARSFAPRDLAAALNGLSREQFLRMREGAREAAKQVNAEREMAKLVGIYKQLLPGGTR